ncbi:MAG: hypothetical protein QOC81_1719 [Thermoanaerobaculia bacterium]|jgi:hypothetical protein|nr:hypothetical protein [Thermoanaerobaculia bacterium]
MPDLYANFDFRLLDDRDFREDSVREELITPLLRALGYTAAGPDRIIRSRPLEHPFVQIGTKRHGINIIPDYLLQIGGENAWILDAKAPHEVIDTGGNVEQAYSYAIHRDVRVPLYALCNGHEIVIFELTKLTPVFRAPLNELSDQDTWNHLLFYVGTQSAMPHGLPLGFRLDYGLHVAKTGIHQSEREVIYMFESLPIGFVAKVADDLYAATGIYGEDGLEFMITFDFTPETYHGFLAALPDDLASRVRSGLSHQPYQVAFDQNANPAMGVAAKLGDATHTNTNESYRPFIAVEFFRAA